MTLEEFREAMNEAFKAANRAHGDGWRFGPWEGLLKELCKAHDQGRFGVWENFNEVPAEARQAVLVAFKLAFT